ncbi:MAG: hypothetical protein V3R81_10210 [Gammaproteobacteria bacterium]
MEDFDEDDARLAALFASVAEPLADDGFSQAIVARLRRRQRVRQWPLGLAALLGLTMMLSLWDGAALVGLLDSISAVTANWQVFSGEISLTIMLGIAATGGAMTALLAD